VSVNPAALVLGAMSHCCGSLLREQMTHMSAKHHSSWAQGCLLSMVWKLITEIILGGISQVF